MIYVKATVVSLIPTDRGFIITVRYDHPAFPEAPTQQRSYFSAAEQSVGMVINYSA